MESVLLFLKETKLLSIVIGVLLGVVLAFLVARLVRKVKSKIRMLKYKVMSKILPVRNVMNTVGQLSQVAREINEEQPTVKSVGGGTKMFMERISKDFPEFHETEASTEVESFIKKLIMIEHGQASLSSASEFNSRQNITYKTKEQGNVSNIKINRTAIYNYYKSAEYATITYRVSVGYDFNSRRVETRYEVEYTLRLKENEIAGKYMRCGVCGGNYDSTGNGTCPYCGAAVIKDTAFHWDITKATEI